eukprot:641503-Prorocentrum_minimum.AAC.1
MTEVKTQIKKNKDILVPQMLLKVPDAYPIGLRVHCVLMQIKQLLKQEREKGNKNVVMVGL